MHNGPKFSIVDALVMGHISLSSLPRYRKAPRKIAEVALASEGLRVQAKGLYTIDIHR